jgi:Arc/MetJ-type ribon-helix-helix transcriptional regulator
MSAIVQARLDPKAQATLRKLVKRTKLSASEVVREALRSLEERYANQDRSSGKRPKLIGVGEFDSGITDLATNPKHMEGFGKKWRVDKSGKGRWDW